MTNKKQLRLFNYLINLKNTLQFKKQLPRIEFIEKEINQLLESLAHHDFSYVYYTILALEWMNKGTNPAGLKWDGSEDKAHLANALGKELHKILGNECFNKYLSTEE